MNMTNMNFDYIDNIIDSVNKEITYANLLFELFGNINKINTVSKAKIRTKNN